MSTTAFAPCIPELLPVIVLIHEAWHRPVHYATFIDTLSSLGYPLACPQLPSAHVHDQQPGSFNDDCSLVYRLVFDLCGDGNDVLVIGHGYGAFVACESLGNLSKRDQKDSGHTGGIIGLIAVAGLLPKLGESLEQVVGLENDGEWPYYIREQIPVPSLRFRIQKRQITNGFVEHEVTRELSACQKDDANSPELISELTVVQPTTFLLNGLGAMEKEHWAAHLVRFTAKPSDVICSANPAWETIPTTYVVCENDMLVPESVQRAITSRATADVELLEDAAHDAFIAKWQDLTEMVGHVVQRHYDSSGSVGHSSPSGQDAFISRPLSPLPETESGDIYNGSNENAERGRTRIKEEAKQVPGRPRSALEEDMDDDGLKVLRRTTTTP